MSSPPFERFRPQEGAILDLASLEALVAESGRATAAMLSSWSPGAAFLILEGLDLDADLSPHTISSPAPPGTRSPPADQRQITVRPGVALVRDAGGRAFVLEVREEVRAPWPTSDGARIDGRLVLVPEDAPVEDPSGLRFARDRITFRVGFLKQDQKPFPHAVTIARSMGVSGRWMTDESRLWQPEHEAVEALVKRLDPIASKIWTTSPEGSVWDNNVLGRDWVRYQTTATAALQAARLDLSGRAMVTVDRVRVLGALFRALQRSVESAATELMSVLGGDQVSGPYRAALGPARPASRI